MANEVWRHLWCILLVRKWSGYHAYKSDVSLYWWTLRNPLTRSPQNHNFFSISKGHIYWRISCPTNWSWATSHQRIWSGNLLSGFSSALRIKNENQQRGLEPDAWEKPTRQRWYMCYTFSLHWLSYWTDLGKLFLWKWTPVIQAKKRFNCIRIHCRSKYMH